MAELKIDTGSGDPPMTVAIAERPLVLGRSPDVDLQIPDQRLSRQHCRVELSGRKLVITDLGSSNGTFARGQRVTQVAIDPGEQFFIGRTQITFLGERGARPSGRHPLLSAPPATPPSSGRVETDRIQPPQELARETQTAPQSPVEGYQVFDRLGEGSMGTVWSARNLDTGETCVLKTVKFGGDPKDAIFFIREAQMGMKLRHPNIVAVMDFGESGGILFLAMEYLASGSLLDRLKKVGPISNAEAVEQLRQLAGALAYAHKKRFVHRDLKPANILFADDGTPKLADFGLAKLMAETRHGEMTRIGETRGTPIYMPPELLSNAADADERADIYSLGATYYHALSGFHPFREKSVVEILRLVASVDPPPVEERNPAVHPRLAGMIRRMMRKKKDERFQSAQELIEELDRLGPEVGES